MTGRAPIVGVVMAGGLSRRMGGGDKALRLLAGKPVLAHVVARAAPQVDRLVLNANGDPRRFGAFDLPVIADGVEGHPGPLAGVLAGLDWAAKTAPRCRYVASFATDAPFLPTDMVARLHDALVRYNAEIAHAESGGQAHPVFALWPVARREALRDAIVNHGIRKVDVWTARYPVAAVAFGTDPIDPFFNINRPDDLARAERHLRAREPADG